MSHNVFEAPSTSGFNFSDRTLYLQETNTQPVHPDIKLDIQWNIAKILILQKVIQPFQGRYHWNQAIAPVQLPVPLLSQTCLAKDDDLEIPLHSRAH